MNEGTMPLKGLKVIELATVVAAPTVGRLLATYGAEVIKIETPPLGDLQRRIGNTYQMTVEDRNNPGFDLYNSGKKLVSINLKTTDGQKIFHRLMEDADIFISNIRMDSLKKMGLDYPTLSERYPRLIYAHLSGYGLKGPDAKRPGFDVSTFWLRTGALTDFVPGGVTHMLPTYGFGDEVTAANLLSGILMAYIARQQTNRGTMVTISLYATGIWTNAFNIVCTQPQFGKKYPLPSSSPDPFSGWFVCGDGKTIYMMVKEYRRDKATYAEIFDMPELLTDPRCENMDTMRDSGLMDYYFAKVIEVMKTKSSDEWIELLEKYDIPYGHEIHFADVYKDEQAWANDSFTNVEYPSGTLAVPNPPVRFSEYEQRAFAIMGGVGENTEEVLREHGFSAEECSDMRARGVIC